LTLPKPTILLVHGAWHRPAVFDKFRAELDKLGYPSQAVKLPTSGPDPRGGMQDDADVVQAAIAAIDGPTVVLAHSYGGIPVSQAGAAPTVEHLVFLAAYQLDQGESMFSFHGAPEPAETEGLFPIIENPRVSLYADVADEEAEAAVTQLVDQRLQSFCDRVTAAPAWRTIESTYIVCEQDKAIPVPEQERMAARAKNVRRLSTSHSPFLSRPAELAALIDEVVTIRG
jgi:pimeloyl-ACP methyl ester carboxylesterase